MNVLSLDAPVVALVWQDFLARCYPTVLRPAGRAVLGLTVWAIYLADRLIDVRHTTAEEKPGESESAAHEFFRRHGMIAQLLLAGVLVADLTIALIWLRPTVFSSGLWAAAAVLGYLAVFARWRIGKRLWKQVLAAILFTTGVFLIDWTQTPDPWAVLGWPAAAFGALCAGNLLLIERWQQDLASNRGWVGMMLLAGYCVVFGNSRWDAAVAMSAAGLAILDGGSERLAHDARRVLADAVLLTPLLFR